MSPGLSVRWKEGYREGEEENQGCFSFPVFSGRHVTCYFFPAPSDLTQLLDYFRILRNGYSSQRFARSKKTLAKQESSYLQAIAKITNN